MAILNEILTDYKILPGPEQATTADEIDGDPDNSVPVDDAEIDQDPASTEDIPQEDAAPEDPNHMGLIRTVKGAHLVYKRANPNGTFEELWFYNSGDMKGELSVRKAILAGTDIPPNDTKSPDGSQTYEIWSVGNGEMLSVYGLPN